MTGAKRAHLLALVVVACSALVFDPTWQSPAASDLGGPRGDQDEWTMVFSDDFDGDRLDREKWATCYWWDRNGCTNLSNNELQWYRPDNVWVQDGQLVLEAREEYAEGRGQDYDFTSGMVTTGRTDPENRDGDRFALTFGYVEVRAKIPFGQGLWPAIWLLPTDHTSIPEIDIMEVLAHAPDTLEMHYHSRVDGDEKSVGTSAVVGDLSQDWHDYAVEWGPDAIVWLLDGQEVWRYDDADRVADAHEPLYLLINLAVGGDWPGSPDETTKFPARMLVDHVRIWQRNAQ